MLVECRGSFITPFTTFKPAHPCHQLQANLAKSNGVRQMRTVETAAFLTGERPAIDIRESLHMLLEFILPDISLLEN